MKLISVDRNVMSGQCKGALARIQIRHTAVFICPGMIKGWAGSQYGLFLPVKIDPVGGYKCVGFEFAPWLSPDIAVSRLPRWYRTIARAIRFRTHEI